LSLFNVVVLLHSIMVALLGLNNIVLTVGGRLKQQRCATPSLKKSVNLCILDGTKSLCPSSSTACKRGAPSCGVYKS